MSVNARWIRGTMLAVLAAVSVAGCDTGDGLDLPPAKPDQNETMLTEPTTPPPPSGAETPETDAIVDPAILPGESMSIVLPWANDTEIPQQYTCKGGDVSPSIEWQNLPEGTAEVAVMMTDATAQDTVHWIVWGLDPSGSLPEGALPDGAKTAVNDFDNAGYSGPCPAGGTHNYSVIVYALNQKLELGSGEPADNVMTAIGASDPLDEAAVGGTFTVS